MFIEGDTERILLPAMIKKLDQEDYIKEFEEGTDPRSLPLLSQNISIIEIGAYSQIFEKFVEFIGTKTLIITDIDTVQFVPDLDDNQQQRLTKDGKPKTKSKACKVADGEATSNSSLNFFYPPPIDLRGLITLTSDQKVLKKGINAGSNKKEWLPDGNGYLRCAFQTPELVGQTSYHGRSFEDAFFHLNKAFMDAHTYDDKGEFIGNEKFGSLVQTHLKDFSAGTIDSYEFAEKGIDKKPSFAMEILLNSTNRERTVKFTPKNQEEQITEDFVNWHTPAYIKEGLLWLKKD